MLLIPGLEVLSYLNTTSFPESSLLLSPFYICSLPSTLFLYLHYDLSQVTGKRQGQLHPSKQILKDLVGQNSRDKGAEALKDWEQGASKTQKIMLVDASLPIPIFPPPLSLIKHPVCARPWLGAPEQDPSVYIGHCLHWLIPGIWKGSPSLVFPKIDLGAESQICNPQSHSSIKVSGEKKKWFYSFS